MQLFNGLVAMSLMALASGSASCQGASRVMRCVNPLRRQSMAESTNRRRVCRTMNKVNACVERLMKRCQDSPEMAAMAKSMNIDRVREIASVMCSRGPLPTSRPGISNGKCSSGYGQRLHTCARSLEKMYQKGPAKNANNCGDAQSSLACVTDIMNKCGQPGSLARTSIINMEQMQGFVNIQCTLCLNGGTPLSSGICNCLPNRSGKRCELVDFGPVMTTASPAFRNGCPDDYSQRLQSCAQSIQGISEVPPTDSAAKCRISNEGVQCLTEIFSNCGDKPDVQTMTRVMNIDQIQALVNSQCNGGPPPTYSPAGSTVNCTSGYAQRLQACIEPIKRFDQAMPSNIAETCRAAQSSMGCLTEIMDDCGGQPEIQAMRNMVNIDQMQELISGQCNGIMMTTSNPVNTDGNVTVITTSSPVNTHGNCPADYVERLQACAESLQRIGQDPPSDPAVKCRISQDGLQCLAEIFTNCSNQTEVQTMSGMMNVDQMQELVNSQCSGGPDPTYSPGESNEDCPTDYAQRLQSCIGPLREFGQPTLSNLTEICSVGQESLVCLTEIMNNCGGKPEIQAMSSVVNIDQMQEQVNKKCAAITPVSGGICPADYVERLQSCAESLQRIGQDPPSDLAVKCRISQDGLQCIAEIFTNCSNQTEVQTMSSMMNIDQMQELVNSQCSGGPDPTYSPGENNENCPTDYAQRLQSCIGPLREFGQPTPSNLSETCSVGQDSLGCLTEIMNNCGGQPEIQAMSSMMNINQMQEQVTKECAAIAPGNGGVCPSDYVDQLVACASPMSGLSGVADLAETCGVLVESFQCSDNIIALCQNQTGLKQVISKLSMDQLRPMMEQSCGNLDGTTAAIPLTTIATALPVATTTIALTTTPIPVTEPGLCSDVRNQLRKCNRLLDGGHRTGDICGPHLVKGFSCMQRLLATCPEDPVVVEFNKMVDLNASIGIIREHCPSLTL